MKKIKSINKISIMLILCILVGLISGIIIKKVNAAGNKPNLDINLEQVIVNGQPTTNYNVNVDANVNDEIEFRYKITPENIAVEDINVPTQKEVVLVLDTSGSMDYDFDGKATSSDENRKITSLKNAAESFITKYTGKNNIKIGIVPYSYYAGYNNEIKELMNVTTQNDADELKKYIENIKPDGATNQGDGLRVAGRMLSDGKSNPAAQKYLIFLTDGEPTATTFKNDNLPSNGRISEYASNVYTFRDGIINRNKYILRYNHNNVEDTIESWYDNRYSGKYEVNHVTDFNEDTNLKYIDFNSSVIADIPTEYGQAVGERLKNEVPNFHEDTIAYGSSVVSDKTSSLKKVNDSMGGTLYSAKDSNAIDSIFNNLADEILEDYTINNVNLNLKLPDSLEFAADETKFKVNGSLHVASIDNIKYKLSNDKKLYVADPFYVTFKLKAKTTGIANFEDLNNISYDNINGQNINQTLLTPNINIVNNIIPNINAHLINPLPNAVVDPSQPIDVKYRIETDPFEYNIPNSIGGSIDEAVFVVDLSKHMSDGNRWAIMQNWVTNILLNDTYEENNVTTDNILKSKDVKFGVVGYNDSVIHPIDNADYDKLFNRNDANEKETLRKFFQEPKSTSHDSIFPSDIVNRNIGSALARADQLLQYKGQPNKNKAIVLVNSGDVYYNQADIQTIKNKGYKIISVDMSCNQNQVSTSNLKTLHSDLLGKDTDYFKSKNSGDNFNDGIIDIRNVAKSLNDGVSSKILSVHNVKINFDLGENFNVVEDGELPGSGKIRTITIPEIKYKLLKDESSGKYLWQQTDPQYIEKEFQIKVAEGKTGKLGFADDNEGDSSKSLKNYISYKKFDNTEIKKHIETPIVTIGMPNVNARLSSINGQTYSPRMVVNPFQPIGVGYQIYTDPFEYNSANSGSGSIDEAVFLMDLSHTANTANEARTELMDPYFEKILINDEVNIFQSQNIKYGIVGYNGAKEYPISGSEYNKLFNHKIQAEKDKLIASISNVENAINKNNSNKINDMAYELDKADKLFTDGLENSRKAIVLVNCSDIGNSVYYSTIINKIKTKGYKIISLNMDWSNGQQKKSGLPELHEALGGKSSDYITGARYNPGQGGSAESDMTEIAKRLNPGTSSTTTISIREVKLNFDLGQNFDAEEDGTLEGIGKIRKITIPRIEYTLKQDSTSGKYKWFQTYPAEVFYKNFNVKVASGKNGQLGFGSYTGQDTKLSTLSYIDFGKTPISKIIETPLITVNQMNIDHGVYEGIQNGKPTIDENEKTFGKGSIVTMAASFDFFSNATIKLELAPNITKDGEIKIYKVDTNGSLSQIGTMSGDGSNYQAAIGSGLSSGDKILVLYNVKLPTIDGHYTNFIQVGDSDKIPARIAVSGELRDLF